MKWANERKWQRHSQPLCPPLANHGGGERVFLLHLIKAAGITRKELAFELRWSKTYVDGILNGEKNDPIEQSRKICVLFAARKRTDLIAALLAHIAGDDDFDGRVLTAEQNVLLKNLFHSLAKGESPC